jgi:hypothetical protein
MIEIPHFAVALHLPDDPEADEPTFSLSAFIEHEAFDPFALYTIDHVALAKELAETDYGPPEVLHAVREWHLRGVKQGFTVKYDEGLKGPTTRYTVMFVVNTPDIMQQMEVKALHRILCLGPNRPAPPQVL